MEHPERHFATRVGRFRRDLLDGLFSLLIALAIVALVACEAAGQTGVAIGTANPTADPSAALDVQSTTQGMLFPRMSASQRTAIASPVAGLLVFDTDTDEFWFHTGSAWVKLDKWQRSGLSYTRYGNVGVGTVIPSHAIDVNGDAHVSGYMRFGVDAPGIRTKTFSACTSGPGTSHNQAHGLDASKVVDVSAMWYWPNNQEYYPPEFRPDVGALTYRVNVGDTYLSVSMSSTAHPGFAGSCGLIMITYME